MKTRNGFVYSGLLLLVLQFLFVNLVNARTVHYGYATNGYASFYLDFYNSPYNYNPGYDTEVAVYDETDPENPVYLGQVSISLFINDYNDEFSFYSTLESPLSLDNPSIAIDGGFTGNSSFNISGLDPTHQYGFEVLYYGSDQGGTDYYGSSNFIDGPISGTYVQWTIY